ncbi:hypothetical protein, partial [Sulfurimonas sp.]|uniref:hypothetical protein n=1 Tax=Sulfurimonas sp. TaxID=2022749 RepID=UPI002610CCE3
VIKTLTIIINCILIPTAASAATLTVPTISISIRTCKISTRCLSAAGKASEKTFLVSREIIFEKIVRPRS